MKPSQYTEYSTVFDFLSTPEFFPVLTWFMTDLVSPELKPAARVTDIGAGTGMFTELLLNHLPTLQITLVEPSPDMMKLAKKRLEKRVNFLEMTVDAALEQIPKQDAFIFQRSLYAIYTNETYCKALLKKLHDKLNPGGKIFIENINEKYEPESYKNYLLTECAKTDEQRQQVIDKFSIFAKSLNTFNELVDAGEFHLFAPGELEKLMNEAGYKQLLPEKDDCYAFEAISA